MSKNIALVLLLALLAAWTGLAGQAQDWNWLSHSSGDGMETIQSVAVDPSGNTLAAVNCQGNCGFGPFSYSGSRYICVVKADPQGNWLWLQHSGNDDNLDVAAIAADAAGNSYIAGYFADSVTLGGTTLTSAGSFDVFAAKLDPAGNWLWARKAGDVLDQKAFDIALDSSANVYVAGRSNDQASLAVWSSAGTPLGGAVYPGTGTATCNDIAVDAVGNIYLAGYFTDSVTFGTTTLTSLGYEDIFTVKVTSSGNVDWARRAGGSSFDRALSLDVDATGSVYLTGSFIGTADFGTTSLTSAGQRDIFVSKLGSGGAWLGTVRAGGMGEDEGSAIAVSGPTAFYLTGYFSNTVSFGTTNLTSNGYRDIFAGKMNSAGTWLWAMGAGSSGGDEGLSLGLDAAGGLRIGGEYAGEAQFGSQILPENDPGGTYDYPEAFLVKIGDVIPRAPENLLLSISGDNAVLAWNPVTETIFSQPVTPDEYVVYYTVEDEIGGPYTELARLAGTSYTHLFVVAAEPRAFYRVTAVKN